MLCRLCGTEQRPIKAHVVPEGFFRALRDHSGVPELRTNTRGVPPKRAPVGVYDKAILCSPCDNVFSPWDKHAQDVLLRDFSESTAISHGDAVVAGRSARDHDPADQFRAGPSASLSLRRYGMRTDTTLDRALSLGRRALSSAVTAYR